MSAIFISYRREDSAAHAGRLYGWFSARFGADRVFMGSGSIALRAGDVAEQLEKRLASCDAMVVVIGRNWLSARHNAGEHRSSDSVDDVELEISLALRRRLLIIPVLVGGANMPSSEDLPPEVRGLAGRNPI